MRPLQVAIALLILASTASAETLGPGTHIVNGLVVTVPAGATIDIVVPTSVVNLGAPTPTDPVEPTDPPIVEGARAKRFRDAAIAINEPETAANLSALFAGLAQKSDPTSVNPLYATPEKLQENLTMGLDIFLIGSKKQSEWTAWRDLLTDEWVLVAKFGGGMADYSALMADASSGLAVGNQAFDITVVFTILEILGDPSKTRFQKILAILPLILSLFAGGV